MYKTLNVLGVSGWVLMSVEIKRQLCCQISTIKHVTACKVLWKQSIGMGSIHYYDTPDSSLLLGTKHKYGNRQHFLVK